MSNEVDFTTMMLGGNGGAAPSESPMPPIPGTSTTTTTASAAPSVEGATGALPGWASMFPGVSPAGQKLDRLAHNESLMAQGADGGTDGAYVTAFENFQGWTHQRIFDAVGELDATATDSVARGWTTLASAADELFMKAFTKIQSTIGTEWEGDAAQAAAQAVTQFANSGHSFTQGMRAAALKIESAAVTTDAVKGGVPVPASVVPDPLMLTSPQAAQVMAEEQRQQAILAMQTMYVPGFTQAGTGVPLLAPPHNAVNSFSMPGDGMSGGSGGGPVDINGVYQGNTSGSGVPAGDAAGAGSGSHGEGSGSPTDSYQAPGAGGGDSTGGVQDGFGGTPAGTRSAGLASPNSFAANGSGSAASLGSPVGGGGSGGSGSGMGGLGGMVPIAGGGSVGGYGGSAGGGVGGAVPGTGSGTGGRGAAGGAAAEEQAATSAAKAARSTSRSMGAMPHGSRQNGEDDEEYRPASYLVSAGNGSELIGELPMVVPAVIGAFVEDER